MGTSSRNYNCSEKKVILLKVSVGLMAELIGWTGTKKIKIGDELFNYSGEIDKKGHACGQGVAVYEHSSVYKYTGTFIKD